MLKVHKHTIPAEDYFSLDLPKGADILIIQHEFHGKPQLWAIFADGQDEPKEIRKFRLADINLPVEEGNCVGTFDNVGDGFTNVYEIK